MNYTNLDFYEYMNGNSTANVSKFVDFCNHNDLDMFDVMFTYCRNKSTYGEIYLDGRDVDKMLEWGKVKLLEKLKSSLIEELYELKQALVDDECFDVLEELNQYIDSVDIEKITDIEVIRNIAKELQKYWRIKL